MVMGSPQTAASPSCSGQGPGGSGCVCGRRVAVFALALVVLLTVAPGDPALGQSRWRPTVSQGGSRPPPPPKVPIPDFLFPRFDWYRWTPVPVPSHADTTYLKLLSFRHDEAAPLPLDFRRPASDLHTAERSTSLFAPVLVSSRLDEPNVPQSFAMPIGVVASPAPTPPPDADSGDSHTRGRFRLAVQFVGTFCPLGDLNDRLIGYELNVTDFRNHDPLRTGVGFGIAFEHCFDPRWSWQAGIEWLEFESRDRQSWISYDSQGNPVSSVRDEQLVAVSTFAFTVDVKRLLPLRDAMFAAGVGADLRGVEMQVSYRYGGALRYDYTSDAEFAFGVRAIVSARVPVAGPLVLSAEGGYRLSSVVHPKIDGATWYWEDGRSTQVASLNLSGLFYGCGLGILF